MNDDAQPFTTKEMAPDEDGNPAAFQWDGDVDILARVRATAEALEATQAQAAQMREALEQALTELESCLGGPQDCNPEEGALLAFCRAALSTDAGRGYVSPERYKAGLYEAWDAARVWQEDLPDKQVKVLRDDDVGYILKGGG